MLEAKNGEEDVGTMFGKGCIVAFGQKHVGKWQGRPNLHLHKDMHWTSDCELDGRKDILEEGCIMLLLLTVSRRQFVLAVPHENCRYTKP